VGLIEVEPNDEGVIYLSAKPIYGRKHTEVPFQTAYYAIRTMVYPIDWKVPYELF
jgi:hypothetical protein